MNKEIFFSKLKKKLFLISENNFKLILSIAGMLFVDDLKHDVNYKLFLFEYRKKTTMKIEHLWAFLVSSFFGNQPIPPKFLQNLIFVAKENILIFLNKITSSFSKAKKHKNIFWDTKKHQQKNI